MTNAVWIAEKPAVGALVANALNISSRKKTHYEGNGNVVTWALGHLIKSQKPENYNPSYKTWSLDYLPMKLYPTVYEPIVGKEDQLAFIGTSLSKADIVYNCCDVDDEGSLIFQELLNYFNYKGKVKRVFISDMNDSAVTKAVNNPKDCDQHYGQYLKAYARSVGDEVFGLSMTRALTVSANRKGYSGSALTVGRVQTPVLSLIVDRYNQNKSHSKTKYYTLDINANSDSGQFKASFIPDSRISLDENGRIVNDGILKSISRLIDKSEGEIREIEVKENSKSAPLPYNLARLQQDMNRAAKLTAQQTLDITQSLRENWKGITYNRSDCSYLSDEQYEEAPLIIESLSSIDKYSGHSFDSTIKSKAFNDKNVTAHTAIIPTGKLTDTSKLTKDEKTVYFAICNNYLAQFMSDKKTKTAKGKAKVLDYYFKFSGSKVTHNGWAELLQDNSEKEGENDEVISSFDCLSKLSIGDYFTVDSVFLSEKETAPPKLFTEATLLSAMTRIADYVKNEKTKRLLKEKDEGVKGEHGSIGTPATRSAIIERLKKSGYIEDSKGSLIPTANAISIINSLPKNITNPDLTALWFQQQNLIAENKLSVDEFIENIYQAIEGEIKNLSSADFEALVSKDEEKKINCPNCEGGLKVYPKLIACKGFNQTCDFKIWRTVSKKKLTDKQLIDIAEKGESGFLSGFISNKGTKYEANLVLKDKSTGALEFKFKPRK